MTDPQGNLKLNLAFTVERVARLLVFTTDLLLQKKAGVTFAEWKAIAAIAEGNCVIEKEIANKLGLNPSTLIPIMDRAEKKGLVVRTRNARDRRKIFVRLSDKARFRLTQMVEIVNRANKGALAGISDQEVLDLLMILHKISDNLEQSRLSSKHLKDQLNEIMKFEF